MRTGSVTWVIVKCMKLCTKCGRQRETSVVMTFADRDLHDLPRRMSAIHVQDHVVVMAADLEW